MQGHIPVPPQPQGPYGLSPIVGYIATREPQPLEGRPAVELEWWEVDDGGGEWPARRSHAMKATAVIVSFSLLLAGLGTFLEIVLSAH